MLFVIEVKISLNSDEEIEAKVLGKDEYMDIAVLSVDVDIEIKISLKSGMLNPEATQVERSLDLLGYEVKNVKTVETIKFQMEGEDREAIRENVVDMCERLLCNPVIHDYKINVIPQNMACGK